MPSTPITHAAVTGAPTVVWSSNWCVDAGAPGELVLSAGADRRMVVDGVTPEELERVRGWSTGEVPDPTGPDAALVARLLEVGVVAPRPPVPPLVVAVAGDDPVAQTLAGLLGAATVVLRPADAHLLVVVRTGRDWPATPTDPAPLQLGVDLSLHHTVVVGPLVVPGVSACLACLDARVRNRWGTAAVPAEPLVTRRLAAVAALVDVQLELITAGTSPLVNATAAWDLERASAEHHHLYRVADCRTCGATVPTGRVSLPWAP